MREKLALAVIALLVCTPAFVHAFDRLSIYFDAALAECTLSDSSPRMANIYVAEASSYGATGLRFRIAASPGFTGVWLGETSPFTKIGSSQTDLSLGFGACLVGHFAVLTVTYQLFGTSTCSNLAIAPASGFPVPICTGCQFDERLCLGYDPLHVNCSDPVNCNPVAVESVTWGQIKALYRN